jgi:hypothetical protein
MQKVEYITDVLVKNDRVSKSELVGYTNSAVVDLGDGVVFKAFKPLIHDYVRTQVIAAPGIEGDLRVRLKVKRLITNKKVDISFKLMSVNRLE